MARLLELLENYHRGDGDTNDKMLWSLDSVQGFSVKSFFLASMLASPLSFPSQLIWDKLNPSKVSLFLWELWWDRALTVDNLIRRGLILPY